MRIGIDPGISGALALMNTDGYCLKVVDMPIMLMGTNKHQVNAPALAEILTSFKGMGDHYLSGSLYDPHITVYLERVQAMPGQGVSSMFNFGTSYGVVQGVVGALRFPMVLVSPASWKKRAGLLGKDKEAARTLAQQLYPDVDLSHKKDIGRADAILIAMYGEKQ